MKVKDIFDNAEKYYINENYKKALDLFKKSYKENATNDCLNYIGCCYLKLEDYISAIEVFERLIKTNPDWERPVLNLGQVYLQSGRFKKALEYFQKAISINDTSEDAYYYLGIYYYKIGDYELSKEYYQKSIKINYTESEPHLNLGMCYFRLKRYEEALKEFEVAYFYDNSCLDAIYNKGLTLIRLSRYKKALDNLFLFKKLAPNDSEVMLDIAHIYYKIKDFKSANIWVNKLLTINPQHNLGNKLLKELENIL